MHTPRGGRPAWAAAAAIASALAAGCAGTPLGRPLPPQAIEVRVEADDPALLATPLDCEARNRAGRWRFSAPGTVSVVPTLDPLQFRCTLPGEGERRLELLPAEGAQAEAVERGRQAGTVIGTGVGVAGAAASAAIAMPAIAPLLLVGGIVAGRLYGELAGAILADRSPEGQPRYRSPVVLRLKAKAE